MESTAASGSPSALGVDRQITVRSAVLLRAERRTGHNLSESERGPYAARRHARRLPLASTTARSSTGTALVPGMPGHCDARPGCGGGWRRREARRVLEGDGDPEFPCGVSAVGRLSSPSSRWPSRYCSAPALPRPETEAGAGHLWTAGRVKMITEPPPVLPLATCPPLGVQTALWPPRNAGRPAAIVIPESSPASRPRTEALAHAAGPRAGVQHAVPVGEGRLSPCPLGHGEPQVSLALRVPVGL